jgi:hypothetical protein
MSPTESPPALGATLRTAGDGVDGACGADRSLLLKCAHSLASAC